MAQIEEGEGNVFGGKSKTSAFEDIAWTMRNRIESNMASNYTDPALAGAYNGYDPETVPSSEALQVAQKVYYVDYPDLTNGARYFVDATAYTPARLDRLDEQGLVLAKVEQRDRKNRLWGLYFFRDQPPKNP